MASVYRCVWWCFAGLIGLIGVAAGVAASSFVTISVMFAMTALCLGTLSANLQTLGDDGRPSKPISVSAVVRHGCLAGLVLVSLFGLGSLIGVAVLPLAALLAVTCPAVIALVRGPLRNFRPPVEVRYDEPAPTRTVAAPAESPPAEVRAMTEAELCLGWRRSFVELQRIESPEARIRIVEFRRRVLDELERRNPCGFELWLASGARAASDPSRYVDRSDKKHRAQ
jgi:hypothetical protein